MNWKRGIMMKENFERFIRSTWKNVIPDDFQTKHELCSASISIWICIYFYSFSIDPVILEGCSFLWFSYNSVRDYSLTYWDYCDLLSIIFRLCCISTRCLVFRFFTSCIFINIWHIHNIRWGLNKVEVVLRNKRVCLRYVLGTNGRHADFLGFWG